MGPETRRTTRLGWLAFVALVVSFSVTIAAAQAVTDFSGEWTAEPSEPASEAAPERVAGRRGDMGSGWGSPITITQDAAQLTVEYAFFTRGDMQPPLRFVYALDGSEANNSVMMGRGMQEQTSTAAWDGGKLVITTTHTFVDPASGKAMPAEVKQTLSLESPTSLVVETVRAGVLGSATTTTRTVYKKS